jgi:hypothetical protein
MTTFLLMLVLSGLALAVGTAGLNSALIGKSQLQDKQAYYLAEAGLQRARQALSAMTWAAASDPGNTYTESFGAGQYRVTIVDDGNDEYTITSEGYVGTTSTYTARRQVQEAAIPVTISSGTNYSLTATASASSSNGTHTPDNANDDDENTYWKSNVNASSWLAMDYGASSPPTINQIIIKEESNVTAVTIEWSDDGSSWTTAAGLDVDEDGETWTATFTAAAHRYSRASLTSGSSKKAEVQEMQSYNTAGGSVSLDTGELTTQW